MFNRISLERIAKENQWQDWHQIRMLASQQAGFINATDEEKRVLEKNFNCGDVNFSVENLNLHASIYIDGELTTNVRVQVNENGDIRNKFCVYHNNKLLSKEEAMAILFMLQCPDCGKEGRMRLQVKNFCRNSPFCKSCQKKVLHKCKSYQNTYEKSMMKMYGVQRPIQSHKVREKMENTMLQRYGAKFSPLCQEIEEKRKITMIEKYGRDNYFSGINPQKEFGTKMPKSGRTSKFEREVVIVLNDIFADHVTMSCLNKQQHVIINNDTSFFLDYYVPTLHLAFETYGDYWHMNPRLFDDKYVNIKGATAKAIRDYDIFREKMIEEALQCNIHVIWEYDWRKNKASVIQLLQEIKQNAIS